jgi:hypothetical protein
VSTLAGDTARAATADEAGRYHAHDNGRSPPPELGAQSLQFLPIERHFASSSGTDSGHVIWVISFGLR